MGICLNRSPPGKAISRVMPTETQQASFGYASPADVVFTSPKLIDIDEGGYLKMTGIMSRSNTYHYRHGHFLTVST